MKQTDAEKQYLDINRQAWNGMVAAHLTSDFYAHEEFLKGKSSLNSIELELLGDLKGKKVLHLQCHFGQDTISLARLGAMATGVDFSEEAIATARDAAAETGADAEFVCCDIYSLPQQLKGAFDIVFSSYGTIGWLPDLDRWASVISHFLKPGGQFVFAEFHPVLWMFDNDFTRIEYPYFKAEAIVEKQSGSYADKSATEAHTCVSWNHGLGEVLGSLRAHGLQADDFREYDYSPYNCFRNTVETAPGKYMISGMEGKLPMVYSLKASKKA